MQPRTTRALFTAIVLLTSAAAAQDEPGGKLLVHGEVRAPSGYRISDVEVAIRDTDLTARTDSMGRFELRGELAAPAPEAEVVAVYPRFEPVSRIVDLSQAPVVIELVMAPARVHDVITVEDFAPASGDDVGDPHELDFLDIVTTAGTFADPLYAAQMLPGVTKIDDGAGLFVRGGDASETATYLEESGCGAR